MLTTQPPIFSYLDYRKYLRDYYQENKRRNPSFSLRYFASQAGVKSYNYLKLVIDGERRLSETFQARFSAALKLNAAEQAYFRALVAFNHASTSRRFNPEQKEALLESLMALRPKSPLYQLDQARLKALKEWYYLPLLELTTGANFRNESAWIAKRLGITSSQARHAIEDLIACGMLESKHGVLSKTHRISDTVDEISQLAVRIYHRKTLQIASTKILEQELHEREFGSISFAAPPERIARLKERIKRFRKELFEFLDEPCEPGQEVYQVNVQLFRVTEPQKKSKPKTETKGVPRHETHHA